MSSALERRQANEDDAIWRQNASIIRQLYQDKRKTLKEVKTIMESEKGFPVMPLSVWEVKLRGLGMQKKLKAKDWSLIYQHVRPRLQHDGKNRLRKPTVLLVNGTKKPWDDCWREIRRNRASSQRPRPGPLPPLPRGIIIRTPSPELLEPILRRQQSKSPHSLLVQLFQTTLLSLQPLFELDSQSMVGAQDLKCQCPTPESVYRLCLEGIPFTILLEKITAQEALLHPCTVDRLEESQDNQIIPAVRPIANVSVAGCPTSSKSQLTGIIAQLLPEFKTPSTTAQELGLNFDSHHYLSMVIYLLSNDLLEGTLSFHDITVSEVLQITFEFVSRRLLLAVFRSPLLSVKAAWERLLLEAQVLKNKEAFEFFINIGMENDWLEQHDKGHEYLFSAAEMNCPDIFRALIDRGCRIALYPSWLEDFESIILETLRSGNLDCARLLIQNCDFNHEFQISRGRYKSTHFAMFIIRYDKTRLDDLNCLELLLEQGANVDYEFQPGFLRLNPYEPLPWWTSGQIKLEKEWPLSVLDCVYYFVRPLFPKLLTYSKKLSRLSRATALWKLEQGVAALREYLDSTKPWEGVITNYTNNTYILERKNHCLEIILAEQFLLSIFAPEKKVYWSRVASFSELDINLTWLSKTEQLSKIMLYATGCLATSEEGLNKEKGLQILQWLLGKGVQVNSEVLQAACVHGDVNVMGCLASFCNDLKAEGGTALIEAVLKNDFNAVKLLLHIGVDPDSYAIGTRRSRVMNVFEAAACGSTLTMMKYLVQEGAKPWVGTSGDRPSIALLHMFQNGPSPEMFNKVQYIIDEHMTIYEPSWPSVPLLELCLFRDDLFQDDELELRRKIFEFLLKKGAGLNIGSPLAKWIATGGGHRLVQEMLDAGADPNAHSLTRANPDYLTYLDSNQTPLQAAAGIGDYTLVCMLLERGAHLNGPALGPLGKTALQAACAWDPVRRDERLRKDKIIQLLLDKGADVNAANCEGYTALMCAAEWGDISTAFTLLKHGAKPNMIWTYDHMRKVHEQTALDIAAWNGRLDMVKFLLNANALSATAWSNGQDYEGAIKRARSSKYSVICELICKHSVERSRWDVPLGTAVETCIQLKHTHQSLSPRTKLTAFWPQTGRQLTASENLPGIIVSGQTNDSSNALEEGAIESSTAAPKAEAQVISGAEAVDMEWTRVIEEIEDEIPLTETGCGGCRSEMNGETAYQAFHPRQATSGPGAWLYQPTEQRWMEDDQQSAAKLVPSSLAEDVFMGFAGHPDS